MNDAPVLSVVMPAYCEGDQIRENFEIVHGIVARLGVAFEIVVIDDGSIDETAQILDSMTDEFPELVFASLARNFGKEGAISAGLDLARGKAVVVMDCDMQHPPDLIPEMFQLWRESDVKVVNAVKQDRGVETAVTSIGSRLFYSIFDRLTSTKLSGSSDFKLLDREVVDAYRLLPERNTFFRGLIAWFGYSQANVYFDVPGRTSGESKWSSFSLIRTAVQVIVSFSAKPLHLVTIIGVFFLIFAGLVMVQTIYRKLGGGAVEGFTTVIILILFSSSILMISLGIIGQYIAQIYDEMKRRPRYLIDRHHRSKFQERD